MSSKPSPGPEPAAEISVLIASGDSYFDNGDVASARVLYGRAADAGNAAAALRMAETYDPALLRRGPSRNVRGDPGEARIWYHRARDLGAAEAEPQLRRLEPGSLR